MTQQDRVVGGNVVIAVVTASAFFLLLVPGLVGPYGLFIDELYYLACSARLDFGYVDHPPLAPLVLRASRLLSGDAVGLALRVPAALAGALTVLLTALMARRLGARAYGQGIAAGALLSAPVVQVMFGFFSMNAFEILLWTVCCFILVEMALRDEPQLWLAFGVAVGVGLENKHTMVLLASGLAVGVLLTRERRWLGSRWPWIGAGIAALIFLPNVLWQVAHGWPSLEFYHNADVYKNVRTPPWEVLLQQVLFANPGTLPVWIAGAVFFLGTTRGARFRHIGWTFAALMTLILVAQKSRPDRIIGIYPVLFAAGGAMWERWTALPAGGARALRYALPVWLAAWGFALAPLGMPVLPPERLARYVAALGVVPQIEQGAGKTAELPQWFADRFGWEQLAEDVRWVAATRLTPEEREEGRSVIFAPSYGQAGALELYGRGELPPVYSTHNNYWLWGPPRERFEAAIVIGDDEEHLDSLFEHVELAAVHDCDWCTRWRDEMPIWVVRRVRPGVELDTVWRDLKHFE